MPELTLHLSDETLELLAEGALPVEQQGTARSHLDACPRCSATFDAYCALFSGLAALPRLAPSPGFTDAVMARVRIAQPPLYERLLQRCLPQSRRGWALLLGALAAPAFTAVALVTWVLSHPLVSVPALAQMGLTWVRTELWVLLLHAVEWLAAAGVVGNVRELLTRVDALSSTVLVFAALSLAFATPLSAWLLYRLLRTPSREVAHAHR